MNRLIVLICAALLIGFILWWFFGKRATKITEAAIEKSNRQEVAVTVNGGYTPHTVVLQQGVSAQIIFERKDPSGCFDEVVFPDFGIRETLPTHEKFAINIDTSRAGEFDYACGMNMFHGKVIIK